MSAPEQHEFVRCVQPYCANNDPHCLVCMRLETSRVHIPPPPALPVPEEPDR